MLVDCSAAYGNEGCNGGLMENAFLFVSEKGICLEEEYPYKAKEGVCQVNACAKKYYIEGYYDIPAKNEEAMKKALYTHGPVSVAIEASQTSFQFYHKGIFNAPCGDNLDHGVLLVGYQTNKDKKEDFFILKNSWGVGWGEEGYMKLAMHAGEAVCLHLFTIIYLVILFVCLISLFVCLFILFVCLFMLLFVYLLNLFI